MLNNKYQMSNLKIFNWSLIWHWLLDICYYVAMKLKIDLHDIFSSGRKIEQGLHDIMQEALDVRCELVEIIPGKGSGQLKKSVLRFLEKNYKGKYHRIEKDDKNFGRIFVHFRHNK